MFIQVGLAPAEAASSTLPDQVRLDDTSEAGVLYIGRAAADALEATAVWQLTRFKNGALEVCATLAAWDDHLTVTYGVEG